MKEKMKVGLSLALIGSLVLPLLSPTLALADVTDKEATSIVSDKTLGIGEGDKNLLLTNENEALKYYQEVSKVNPNYLPSNAITNLDISGSPNDLRELEYMNVMFKLFKVDSEEKYKEIGNSLIDFAPGKPYSNPRVEEEGWGKALIGQTINFKGIQDNFKVYSIGAIHNNISEAIAGSNPNISNEVKEKWAKLLSDGSSDIASSRIKLVEIYNFKDKKIKLKDIISVKDYSVEAISNEVSFDRDLNEFNLGTIKDFTALIKVSDPISSKPSYVMLNVNPKVEGDYKSYINSEFYQKGNKETNGLAPMKAVKVYKNPRMLFEGFSKFQDQSKAVYANRDAEKAVRELANLSVKIKDQFPATIPPVDYTAPEKGQSTFGIIHSAMGVNVGKDQPISILKSSIFMNKKGGKTMLQYENEGLTEDKLKELSIYELQELYKVAYVDNWANLGAIYNVLKAKLEENVKANNGKLVIEKPADKDMKISLYYTNPDPKNLKYNGDGTYTYGEKINPDSKEVEQETPPISGTTDYNKKIDELIGEFLKSKGGVNGKEMDKNLLSMLTMLMFMQGLQDMVTQSKVLDNNPNPNLAGRTSINNTYRFRDSYSNSPRNRYSRNSRTRGTTINYSSDTGLSPQQAKKDKQKEFVLFSALKNSNQKEMSKLILNQKDGKALLNDTLKTTYDFKIYDAKGNKLDLKKLESQKFDKVELVKLETEKFEHQDVSKKVNILLILFSILLIAVVIFIVTESRNIRKIQDTRTRLKGYKWKTQGNGDMDLTEFDKLNL